MSGALKGLRQDKGEESYLRVLMLHFGCGLSMRETVTRANEAKLAKLSSVALFKRLRKSREWLYQLCRALFEERGVRPAIGTKHNLRLVDGTLIKEPGPTGAQWRIHYSLSWPALQCDSSNFSPCSPILRQVVMSSSNMVLHSVRTRSAICSSGTSLHTRCTRLSAQKRLTAVGREVAR